MRKFALTILGIALLAAPASAQMKSLADCFMDNEWYELDGKDRDLVGHRYEPVATCLCATGIESSAEDMRVFCRKDDGQYVCYKGNPLSRTFTGEFEDSVAKACQ